MKKYFLALLTFLGFVTAQAQTRGVQIAYIDMEYILDKVPDYAEAKSQLEQKAQKWKQEMEVKQNDINKLKDNLKAERPLLTKELIDEREEEIAFQEKELSDYQQKRFGPTGDLITQKAVLVKPIQDQVFNIIQDLAESRHYDFVFDKSSDMTMLFGAKRHDISDLVVRRLTRAANREKLSKSELKRLDEQDAKEEMEADPAYQERQKQLEDRKAEREKKLADRKAAQEAKRKEYQEKRDQLLREREAKRNGTATPPANDSNAPGQSDVNSGDDAPAQPDQNRPANTGKDKTTEGDNSQEVKTTATGSPNLPATQQSTQEERQQRLEARKKAQEERRQKAIEQREAAKKAREEQIKKQQEERNTASKDTISDGTGGDDAPAQPEGNN